MKYLGESLIGREVRFPLSENGVLCGTVTSFFPSSGARIEWDAEHWGGYPGAPGYQPLDSPQIEFVSPDPNNALLIDMPYRVKR